MNINRIDLSKYENINESLNRAVFQSQRDFLEHTPYDYEIIFFKPKINNSKNFRLSILHTYDHYIFNYMFFSDDVNDLFKHTEKIPHKEKTIIWLKKHEKSFQTDRDDCITGYYIPTKEDIERLKSLLDINDITKVSNVTVIDMYLSHYLSVNGELKNKDDTEVAKFFTTLHFLNQFDEKPIENSWITENPNLCYSFGSVY